MIMHKKYNIYNKIIKRLPAVINAGNLFESIDIFPTVKLYNIEEDYKYIRFTYIFSEPFIKRFEKYNLFLCAIYNIKSENIEYQIEYNMINRSKSFTETINASHIKEKDNRYFLYGLIGQDEGMFKVLEDNYNAKLLKSSKNIYDDFGDKWENTSCIYDITDLFVKSEFIKLFNKDLKQFINREIKKLKRSLIIYS